MVAWLLVVFASMALAAESYLSIHLAEIVTILKISEDIAGVTIFAFGNGSSDLFSTFAAMGSGNGSLAISELFGAAAFITTVVLGLVIVIQPFSVSPGSFVGDVIWFMIAAILLTTFLADGRLVAGECLGSLAIYAAFIAYSLLLSMRFGTAPMLASFEQSEDQADEQTRLLPTEGDQQAEVRRTLCVSADHESSEGLCANRSSSLTQKFTETSRDIVLKLFPSVKNWGQKSNGEKILTFFSIPLMVPISLTTLKLQATLDQQQSAMSTAVLDVSEHSDPVPLRRNLLSAVPLLLGPQLIGLVFTNQLDLPLSSLWLICPAGLLFSTFHLGLNLTHRMRNTRLLVNAVSGFVVSLIWIYLTATSAVSLLTTLGLILNIPITILGGTIFAIGNSSNDLVANTAVARRGMPVLAASACFGGPMMNTLLGIGIGGLVQVLKDSAKNKMRGGDYVFDVSPGMFISIGTLLTGLTTTLIYSYSNDWRLNRRLGYALILVWVVGTVANVTINVVEKQRD